MQRFLDEMRPQGLYLDVTIEAIDFSTPSSYNAARTAGEALPPPPNRKLKPATDAAGDAVAAAAAAAGSGAGAAPKPLKLVSGAGRGIRFGASAKDAAEPATLEEVRRVGADAATCALGVLLQDCVGNQRFGFHSNMRAAPPEAGRATSFISAPTSFTTACHVIHHCMPRYSPRHSPSCTELNGIL